MTGKDIDAGRLGQTKRASSQDVGWQHHTVVWVHTACCGPLYSKHRTTEEKDQRCCSWPRLPIWAM